VATLSLPKPINIEVTQLSLQDLATLRFSYVELTLFYGWIYKLSMSKNRWLASEELRMRAKIMQTKTESSSLFKYSAEFRWILGKDTARFLFIQWNQVWAVSQSFNYLCYTL